MAQLLSTAESRDWQHSSAAFHAWLVHTLLLPTGEMRSSRGARPGLGRPPHHTNPTMHGCQNSLNTAYNHFTSNLEPVGTSKVGQ